MTNSTSSGKLRIAQVINSVVLGGGGQVISSLARNIDQSRFDMDVHCVVEGGEFLDDIRQLGISVNVSPVYDSHRHFRYDFKAWMNLARSLRRGHYDIVHTHLYRADVIGRVAAIIAGNHTIVKTLHNMGTWKRLPQRLTDRALNTFTDTIICVSNSQRSLAIHQEWLAPSKIQVIYNGVDVSRFHCAVNRRTLAHGLGMDPDAMIIGTVGRLIHEKDHLLLIQAAPEIQRRFPGSQFLLVGDGPLRSAVEAQIAKFGLRGVVITGLRKDVPELLALMDVFVFPSLSEACPIAIFEAMAAGRPIACSDIPSLAEIVRDNETALVFPARDASSLAARVCDLLGDTKLRESVAAAAYRDVQDRFSEVAMTRAYEQLYVALAGAR